MSKYIDKDLALSYPFANGKYDKENASPDFIKGCESYKEWLESLPAVEIKNVPDTNVGDMINRQAAIKAIYETFCYAYCDNCEKEMNEDLCGDCHRKYQNWAASKKIISKTINSLPSAERNGRWLDVEPAPYKLFYATCSACGVRQTLEVVKYCPHCGARIDLDEVTE